MTELVVIRASDEKGLIGEMTRLIGFLDRVSGVSLTDVAYTCSLGKGDLAGVSQTLDEVQTLTIIVGSSSNQQHLSLLGRRHIHLGTAGTDRLDGVHDSLHGSLFLGEVESIL
ncbi:MAG: hypothetical protein IIW14_10355, partial [Kiritimatiellae bacterium]|nr:hypothetical protein [Kiritimatiellia bacterium]